MNFFVLVFNSLYTEILGTNNHFSVMKDIDGILYVGGKNILQSYILSEQKLTIYKSIELNFTFMNWSYVEFTPENDDFPKIYFPRSPSMAFDNCLNWQQDHVNESYRNRAFDYQHLQYHTPAGNWNISNYFCTNNFIKAIEKFDNDTLWVCGTTGSFPKAFLVNRTSLEFIKFVDVNMMSCARYVDEPMAIHRDSHNNLYIGSGWGLYRPDKKDPDVPNNNSTMLYADWRLNKNLFTLPASMAWVLSSDVNFIDVVKETETHLYFFGHEINNQYGINNQEDRHAWQSFMLRICKNDSGFKYVPTEMTSLMKHMSSTRYYIGTINNIDYQVSPIHEDSSHNPDWYHKTAHLPTKHFVSQQKINFGCYIGKRPRAISDNYFWGETNVVYLNKLADVIFDPNKVIKFRTKNNNPYFGCINQSHEQIPLIGIFNSPGIQGTPITPTGALCQLQINANIFNEIGSKKKPYHFSNLMNVNDAHEEIMLLNSVSISNFYSRTLHRTNGLTLYPFWNQGIMIGDHKERPYYRNIFDIVGKCQNSSFYNSMTKDKFLRILNFSNTAWPNELPNRLSSIPSAICQFSAAELYSFNATFMIAGVEFKKIFLVAENITNYYMPKLKNETIHQRNIRKNISPIMILIIVSNSGLLFRVVLCDFDNGMLNHGEDKTSDEWYNWCIFRHTDQPYLYRQYAPMESRKRGKTYQYRASSLLMEERIVRQKESSSYIDEDSKFNQVKDILRKGDLLYVLTTSAIYNTSIKIDCSKYTKCIECASDPQCMWDIFNSKCTNYIENSDIPKKYIQDVLDRGFICYKAIQHLPQSINAKDVTVLNCLNSIFWRGSIFWKVNETEINSTNTDVNYLFVDDKLIIINNTFLWQYQTNISCYGMKSDHDKLYDEAQYEWETVFFLILLSTFMIIPVKPVIPVKPDGFDEKWIFIIVIISLICLIVYFAGYYQKKRKCKQKSNNEEKLPMSSS